MDRLNEKAAVYGLKIRLVDEKDAAQLVKLRTDSTLAMHLHKTDSSIEKQISYIKAYKERENKGEEFYFAFSLIDADEPIGFYRVLEINHSNKSFGIGSWIFEHHAPDNVSVLADILAKDFGFNQLNLDCCYFDVRRNNKKVYKYHQLFSPVFINEDEEENNYFFLKKENFEENKNKILQFII